MNSIILPLLVIIGLTLTINYLLIYLKDKLPKQSEELANSINMLLPQTQCGQCNYPGCKPYANAIAKQETDINQCPPGGQSTIDNIANLLNIPSIELAGNVKPTYILDPLAIINEDTCIGCLLCIKACPVDAIVGAPQKMHTVIADLCTGCELCISPCPMDCIDLIPRSEQVSSTAVLDIYESNNGQ